jgi:hypothetical protein
LFTTIVIIRIETGQLEPGPCLRGSLGREYFYGDSKENQIDFFAFSIEVVYEKIKLYKR